MFETCKSSLLSIVTRTTRSSYTRRSAGNILGGRCAVSLFGFDNSEQPELCETSGDRQDKVEQWSDVIGCFLICSMRAFGLLCNAREALCAFVSLLLFLEIVLDVDLKSVGQSLRFLSRDRDLLCMGIFLVWLVKQSDGRATYRTF
jgi:hypothetical protein